MRSNLPSGLGFYLYIPNDRGWRDISALVGRASEIGASWLAPRVVGWANLDSNTQEFMDDLVRECERYQMRLGGWGYHVLCDASHRPPRSPATGDYEPEAAKRAIDRWGLSFYVVNSEHELKAGTIPYSGWQRRDGAKLRARARIFWETLRGYFPYLPIGMTSYRFPSLHREFIWDAMTDPAFVDFNQPQLYWLGDYNVNAGKSQLARSVEEFDKLGVTLPYIPIIATYKAGDWYATPAQIDRFTGAVGDHDLIGYGCYTFEHANEHQLGALEALWADDDQPPPPPDDDVPVDALERLWRYAQSQGWQV